MQKITEKLIQDYILWKFYTEVWKHFHSFCEEGIAKEIYGQFGLDIDELERLRSEEDESN